MFKRFPPADEYTTACRILHLRFQQHSEGRQQELHAKLALEITSNRSTPIRVLIPKKRICGEKHLGTVFLLTNFEQLLF